MPTDPNWQMTIYFLVAVTLTVSLMKLVALLLPATVTVERPVAFFFLPSPLTRRKLRPMTAAPRVLSRMLLILVALALSYVAYTELVRVAQLRGVALSYLAAPILLLMVEAAVALVTVLWLPSGRVLPPVHHRPWASRSVADFWGNRWNLWFSDWARYAIFQRLRHRPVLTLMIAFSISGLLHEGIINLSLYWVTGRVLFGTMMLYFLLQAVGILVEHRLKGRLLLQRVFTWLVILGPAPLIINEGLLRTMHLWPD